jgi:hypothetical protein
MHSVDTLVISALSLTSDLLSTITITRIFSFISGVQRGILNVVRQKSSSDLTYTQKPTE